MVAIIVSSHYDRADKNIIPSAIYLTFLGDHENTNILHRSGPWEFGVDAFFVDFNTSNFTHVSAPLVHIISAIYVR